MRHQSICANYPHRTRLTIATKRLLIIAHLISLNQITEHRCASFCVTSILVKTFIAIATMNSFVNDNFEFIGKESNQLAHYIKTTVKSDDIRRAFHLLKPVELAMHELSEATKTG